MYVYLLAHVALCAWVELIKSLKLSRTINYMDGEYPQGLFDQISSCRSVSIYNMLIALIKLSEKFNKLWKKLSLMLMVFPNYHEITVTEL